MFLDVVLCTINVILKALTWDEDNYKLFNNYKFKLKLQSFLFLL